MKDNDNIEIETVASDPTREVVRRLIADTGEIARHPKDDSSAQEPQHACIQSASSEGRSALVGLFARRGRDGRSRPRWSRIAVLSGVLLCLLYPWHVLVTIVLLVSVLTAAYLTLGPERFAEIAEAGSDRLARRHPKLAQGLARRKAQVRRHLTRLPMGLGARFAPPAPLSAEVQAKLDQEPFERLG